MKGSTWAVLLVFLLLYPLSITFAFQYFYTTTPQLLTAGIVIKNAHDIALANLASRTVFGQGFTYSLNMTSTNQGSYTDSFNINLSINSTEIARQGNITLLSGAFTISTLVWNTTGFARGNYTLTVYAEPVTGELDLANNNITVSIRVGIPGDISGVRVGSPDGTVNMRDIAYLVLLFNTKPNSPNWNPNADINDDGTVNMRDIAIAVMNFGKLE
jgi:hypothetical protein